MSFKGLRRIYRLNLLVLVFVRRLTVIVVFEGIRKFNSLCKENAANIVLVACGHPLQDQLIIDFKKELSAVFVGVGGSFDVWSGLKNEPRA